MRRPAGGHLRGVIRQYRPLFGSGIGGRAEPQFGAVFPQVLLQCIRVQAHQDLAEVHYAERASGQKPAFTEDLHFPKALW
jgi:hypothetical protein